MAMEEAECRLTILCPKKSLLSSSSASEGVGIRWLIGSPLSLPPFTVVSAIRCLHALPTVDPYSPDILREADDLRSLLIRGFDIIGALFVGNINLEEGARKAIEASSKLRSLLLRDEVHDLIGAVADPVSGDIQFCVSHFAKTTKSVNNVVYEDNPERYMWEKGCLLRCDLEFKLPFFLPEDKVSDFELNISSSIDAAAAKLRDPNVAYLIQGSDISTAETSRSILVHGTKLDLNSHYTDLGTSNDKSSITGVTCSDLCRKNKVISLSVIRENADAIHVTVLSNKSRNKSETAAPHAEYFPAPGRARVLSIDFNLDVLCFASEDLPISDAISKLIIPGLCDQLDSTKKAILPEILSQHPRLRPYHFLPPRLLHPITVIYELSYGETEVKQGEIRKSLHSRLDLPLDRPLLRISSALNFGINDVLKNDSVKPGYSVLKDVHSEIPSSGVSGGIISLIDGSYEYYHYLHGIDDNGWGCAYRSLQTIISWYRLQKYTSIEVPSHREIQQALVEIGDKEPSFVGSREWIGAIELSFVLDKLLGVSCKIINVRSGEELPEKCRELAMHFETQGTPVMIGGGVLAYTLLGVDYNEISGDCAFLILDPHYTGSDNIKKIVNGGWCGWKKSVDAKGHSFFLKDKFYNLLLPQRPNIV